MSETTTTRLIRPRYATAEPYEADVDRLIAVAAAAGYEIDRDTARWVWTQHSDDFAAGWLMMDGYEDADLVGIMCRKCEGVSRG